MASLSEICAIDDYRECLFVMFLEKDKPFLMSLVGFGFSECC